MFAFFTVPERGFSLEKTRIFTQAHANIRVLKER